VNTVALGVKEKDAAALEELAEMTGGKFRPYTNEELKEIADDLPDTPKDFSDTSLKYLSLAEVRSRQSRQRGLKRPPPEEKDVVSFEID
jgi:hypothetical protein